MARKEEMESLARREGQEGEGMRGSHGRRELSQGGAEGSFVYVRITWFKRGLLYQYYSTCLKVRTKVIR